MKSVPLSAEAKWGKTFVLGLKDPPVTAVPGLNYITLLNCTAVKN